MKTVKKYHCNIRYLVQDIDCDHDGTRLGPTILNPLGILFRGKSNVFAQASLCIFVCISPRQLEVMIEDGLGTEILIQKVID